MLSCKSTGPFARPSSSASALRRVHALPVLLTQCQPWTVSRCYWIHHATVLQCFSLHAMFSRVLHACKFELAGKTQSRMYLVEKGFFGCPATQPFRKLLACDCRDFKSFQAESGIRCTQATFVPNFSPCLN